MMVKKITDDIQVPHFERPGGCFRWFLSIYRNLIYLDIDINRLKQHPVRINSLKTVKKNLFLRQTTIGYKLKDAHVQFTCHTIVFHIDS